MKQWLDQHPAMLALLLPAYLIFVFAVVLKAISVSSGWSLLTRRFRLQGDFSGTTWKMQSARLRGLAHYNNCLEVGAGARGLLIRPSFIVRYCHPPLLVPWNEITFAGRKKILFWDAVTLTLGRDEQVPFTILASLADKLKAAAGDSWPSEQLAAIS